MVARESVVGRIICHRDRVGAFPCFLERHGLPRYVHQVNRLLDFFVEDIQDVFLHVRLKRGTSIRDGVGHVILPVLIVLGASDDHVQTDA